MPHKFKYLIAVDGGGSSTRILIQDIHDKKVGQVKLGPSALGQGIDKAWQVIISGIKKIDRKINLKQCAIVIGISGANVKVWKKEFLDLAPAFFYLNVQSDALISIKGAFENDAGSLIAIGTGSIGLHQKMNGKITYVAGWGFPSGDDGSGSWLGLKAINLLEHAFDGRLAWSPLTRAIAKNKFSSKAEQLLSWLAIARQHHFASLAPIIFSYAKKDPSARKILKEAAWEMMEMARALDDSLAVPIVISGSVGKKLIEYTPISFRKKIVKEKGDALVGAIYMLKSELYEK